MKDGTVYKGKILIDTDKAILIGNPPYDPVSYLLEAKDIDKIIYEKYVQPPPAVRKRGFGVEARLDGNAFSSSDLSLHAAPGLYLGGLFRVHPLFEFEGGVEWLPAIGSDGLCVTNINGPCVDGNAGTRQYDDFFAYTGEVGGRIYPFYRKKWKTEPYLTVGYGWSRLIPKASGDSLHGAGWHAGIGAQRPLTRHLFLETRFVFEAINYDAIHFLGQDGSIEPSLNEHRFELSAGLSYRL